MSRKLPSQYNENESYKWSVDLPTFIAVVTPLRLH